ncbi:MAG TPA: FxsA family protein, partial [Pseudomonadales bacterium]|nr:FxsA family protein [Pseudomonadales bacterium]
MRWLLWLLLAMPLIELWFIIRVGSSIGGLATIALLLGAGILGMNLLRLQGFNTLTKLDQRLQRGELPAVEIL